MKFPASSALRFRSRRAFTLVELLVGMGIAGIVLAALMSLVFYTSRSFAALANYVDLDAYSKNALDRMTTEVRQVKQLLSGTESRLIFEDWDGGTLSYLYNPKAKTLLRVKNGAIDPQPLLRGCDSLKFALFQRNPKKGNYDQYEAATAATCKLIQMQWTCSRDLIYSKQNTESILSAKIVIRNNPKAKTVVGPGTI